MDKWTESPIQQKKNSNKQTRFEFEVDGHKIVVEAGKLNGKEIVYVDGALCSEKRTFRKKSSHKVRVADNELEVKFEVPSIFRSKVYCSLTSGEQILDTYSCTYKIDNSTLITSFIVICITFFTLGFVKSSLGLSHDFDKYVYVLQAVFVAILTWYVMSTSHAIINHENA